MPKLKSDNRFIDSWFYDPCPSMCEMKKSITIPIILLSFVEEDEEEDIVPPYIEAIVIKEELFLDLRRQ